MAVVSLGADAKAYMPVKFPLSGEAHIKAIDLKAANAFLTSPLCANPILPMVATLAIFKAMLDSNSMVPKDKVQVA